MRSSSSPETKQGRHRKLPVRRNWGEGNCNPLQYSCLENPIDRGAWWAPVHGVTRVRHGLVTKPSAMPYMIYLIQIIYAIQMIINDTHMHVLFFGPT